MHSWNRCLLLENYNTLPFWLNDYWYDYILYVYLMIIKWSVSIYFLSSILVFNSVINSSLWSNLYDENLISTTRITDPNNDYCLEPSEEGCHPADKTVLVYRQTSRIRQDDSSKFTFKPDRGITGNVRRSFYVIIIFITVFATFFTFVNTTISFGKIKKTKLSVK